MFDLQRAPLQDALPVWQEGARHGGRTVPAHVYVLAPVAAPVLGPVGRLAALDIDVFVDPDEFLREECRGTRAATHMILACFIFDHPGFTDLLARRLWGSASSTLQIAIDKKSFDWRVLYRYQRLERAGAVHARSLRASARAGWRAVSHLIVWSRRSGA